MGIFIGKLEEMVSLVNSRDFFHSLDQIEHLSFMSGVPLVLKPSSLLMHKNGKEVIACLEYSFIKEEKISINALFVSPLHDNRRKGYGSFLLEYLGDFGVSHNFNSLLVLPNHEEYVVNFYKKNGFLFKSNSTVLMEKNLI